MSASEVGRPEISDTGRAVGMEPLPATAEVLDWLADAGDQDVRRRVSWICETVVEVVPDALAIGVWFLDEDLALAFTEPAEQPSAIADAVRSSLTLTFGLTAAVTVYSSRPDAFVHHAPRIERHLGAVPGRAVLDADLGFDLLERARRAPSQLRARRDVDMAVGLLMGLDDLSVDQAERYLHFMARTSGRTVEAVAAEVVAASGITTSVDAPTTASETHRP